MPASGCRPRTASQKRLCLSSLIALGRPLICRSPFYYLRKVYCVDLYLSFVVTTGHEHKPVSALECYIFALLRVLAIRVSGNQNALIPTSFISPKSGQKIPASPTVLHPFCCLIR